MEFDECVITFRSVDLLTIYVFQSIYMGSFHLIA